MREWLLHSILQCNKNTENVDILSKFDSMVKTWVNCELPTQLPDSRTFAKIVSTMKVF